MGRKSRPKPQMAVPTIKRQERAVPKAFKGDASGGEEYAGEYDKVYRSKIVELQEMSLSIRNAQKVLQRRAALGYTAAQRAETRKFDLACDAYIVRMNALAIYCLSHGKSEECVRLLSEAKKLSKPEWGQSSRDLHILCLNNLSCYERYLGNLDEALELLKTACKLGKLTCVDSEYLPLAYLNICATLSILGRHEAAFKEAQISISVCRRALKHLNRSSTLSVQAMGPTKRQKYRNVEIALLLGYYNAAVESEFLGRDDLTAHYFAKSKNVLGLKLSWILEYAVCPNLGESNQARRRKEQKVQKEHALVIPNRYSSGDWKLEAEQRDPDSQTKRDQLFSAWKTVRRPKTKNSAIPIMSPRKSKKKLVRRSLPNGIVGLCSPILPAAPIAQMVQASTNPDVPLAPNGPSQQGRPPKKPKKVFRQGSKSSSRRRGKSLGKEQQSGALGLRKQAKRSPSPKKIQRPTSPKKTSRPPSPKKFKEKPKPPCKAVPPPLIKPKVIVRVTKKAETLPSKAAKEKPKKVAPPALARPPSLALPPKKKKGANRSIVSFFNRGIPKPSEEKQDSKSTQKTKSASPKLEKQQPALQPPPRQLTVEVSSPNQANRKVVQEQKKVQIKVKSVEKSVSPSLGAGTTTSPHSGQSSAFGSAGCRGVSPSTLGSSSVFSNGVSPTGSPACSPSTLGSSLQFSVGSLASSPPLSPPASPSSSSSSSSSASSSSLSSLSDSSTSSLSPV